MKKNSIVYPTKKELQNYFIMGVAMLTTFNLLKALQIHVINPLFSYIMAFGNIFLVALIMFLSLSNYYRKRGMDNTLHLKSSVKKKSSENKNKDSKGNADNKNTDKN